MSKKLSIVFLSTFILLISITSAYAYTVLSYTQNFYYNNVVAYKWSTGTWEPYTSAFETALSDWNNSQSDFQWGYCEDTPSGCSDNQMGGVYYLENSTQTGRTQISASNGHYTRAWCEMNQWVCDDKTSTYKRSVANHEVGHAMSLADNNNVTYSIMNQNRNRTSIYVPQSADINAVTTVY